MKKPTLRSSKIIYRGFFDVRSDQIVRSDGAELDYTYIAPHVDGVIVIAETSDELFIVNREYRPPIKEWVLGLPGGRLEPGENLLKGAARELLEETGYLSQELSFLGTCFPLPGLLDQKIHFVSAKNATKQGTQKLDPFEFINVELKTWDELRNEIQDSHSSIDSIMCAALWYKSQV